MTYKPKFSLMPSTNIDEDINLDEFMEFLSKIKSKDLDCIDTITAIGYQKAYATGPENYADYSHNIRPISRRATMDVDIADIWLAAAEMETFTVFKNREPASPQEQSEDRGRVFDFEFEEKKP